MMFYLVAALFASLAVAQTCNTATAQTCATTFASCAQAAGNNVPAACACSRTYLNCLTGAGCCSDPLFQQACQTAQNALNQAGCQSSSGSCFHKDTMITYEGKNMALSELETSKECAIPHTVWAVGSTITARCGAATHVLRLTSNHLVYTQRGLQPAGDLIVGKDEVYADLKETQPCTIVKVEKDAHAQEFFGLNCYSSSVLASGIKTSTFEKVHSVPAFWMQVVGKVLGIKRASSIGDHIEKILSKMNLI